MEETLWLIDEEISNDRKTTEITRRNIINTLVSHRDLEGRLGIIPTLARAPIQTDYDLSSTVYGYDWSFGEETPRRKRPPDYGALFMRVGLLGLSEKRFFRVLEVIVSAPARLPEDGQSEFVEALNQHLRRDKLELRPVAEESGYPIFKVLPTEAGRGVQGRPKNLIFASNGPKPVIGFKDAINNDIVILKNEEFCLKYDRPFPSEGLLWKHLVAWWIESQGLDPADSDGAAKSLGKRLRESLMSSQELLVFNTYASVFYPLLGEQLPALIPQVYLHYDPATTKALGGSPRFHQQRMDFLMLLSYHVRIVIEVDGKQHYATVSEVKGRLDYKDSDPANPRKYAAMVSEDRDLRLSGYEVYRFGVDELTSNDAGRQVIKTFFQKLFAKHNVRKE